MIYQIYGVCAVSHVILTILYGALSKVHLELQIKLKQNTPSEVIRSVPAADRDAAVALVDAELLLEPLRARAAGVAAGRVLAGRGRRPRLREAHQSRAVSHTVCTVINHR